MLLVHPLYQKHNKVDDKRQRHHKAYNDNKGLFIHTCLSVSPSHTREHKKGSAPKNAQRKRLSPTRVKRSAVLCIKSTSLVLRYTGQTVGFTSVGDLRYLANLQPRCLERWVGSVVAPL